MEEYRAIIRDFLQKNRNIKELSDDDDLFKSGFVDSLFSLQLIVFLEKNFKIKISNKEIKEENFKTVNNIVGTVTRLTNK